MLILKSMWSSMILIHFMSIGWHSSKSYFTCFVLLTIIVVSMADSGLEQNTLDSENHRCKYNEVMYEPGVFHPDSCTSCICDDTLGHVLCSVTNCANVAGCLQFEHSATDCCPRCIEYGCQFNGSVYPAGSKIPTGKNACEKCFCPWDASENGGDVFCVEIKCKTQRCVDPIIPEGKCCPVCPRGPNCYLDDRIISEGERIYVGGCRGCFCSDDEDEYLPRDSPRHATCVRSFFCL